MRSASYPNVHVVGSEATFVGPAAGIDLARNPYDGVHTTVAGAFKMGKTLDPVLARLIAQAAQFPATRRRLTSRIAVSPLGKLVSSQRLGCVRRREHVLHYKVPRAVQPGA